MGSCAGVTGSDGRDSLGVSDPFATVFCMQSEQRRQRRKERKRLNREEKRRTLAGAPPLFITRIDPRHMRTAEKRAQMCASGEPQMCAREEDLVLPSRTDRKFWEAVRIARRLVGRRISVEECIELMALTYLASGPRGPPAPG